MVAEPYNRLQSHMGQGGHGQGGQGQGQQRGEGESMTGKSCAAASQTFQEYPIAATFGMFALGLGIGTAIGAMMAKPMGFVHERSQAENIGRRILDSIADYMPESVQRRIHS